LVPHEIETLAVFRICIIPLFPQNEEHAGDLEARITRYLAITSADIEEFPPQVISTFLPVPCKTDTFLTRFVPVTDRYEMSVHPFFGFVNNFSHWGKQSFLA
jgi:hypothetical protein